LPFYIFGNSRGGALLDLFSDLLLVPQNAVAAVILRFLPLLFVLAAML
jgi:hypothetical protein